MVCCTGFSLGASESGPGAFHRSRGVGAEFLGTEPRPRTRRTRYQYSDKTQSESQIRVRPGRPPTWTMTLFRSPDF